MPIFSLDLSDAQSLKPIPDDTYPAEVAELNGPHQGDKAKYATAIIVISDGDFEGRKFYHNMPIEGQGAGIFVDFVNKVTGSDYDVDDMEELEVDPEDLIGAAVAIVTKTEEYPKDSGEMRSSIKKLLAADA